MKAGFMDFLMSMSDAVLNWLASGLLGWNGWEIALFTLVATHITIAAVTIFLHRAQAHRALELHAIPAHFFRFWLWLTTGMVTKEWVAIHRKHHAKCETEDDPHSPQTRGINTVLLTGSELYRAEAKNQDTLAKFGHGTPDDWIERNLYTPFSWQGVGVMLIVDVMLFGAIGATVWAVQMLWIPITAAGIINGIGHWWGYRNFEAPDASTNVSPWGVMIGGEELHNNHHTYPTSAKLSVKPYEFDIGWAYIRGLEMLGLAKVRKTPPMLKLGKIKPVADDKTLDAIIANRYEVMAKYARSLRRASRAEVQRLESEGVANCAKLANLRLAKRWLHRDSDKIPTSVKAQVALAIEHSPLLANLVAMREELRMLWTRTNVSAEQLVADLQAWCRKAEESGIAALQDFALKLRAAHG
jgi:stearoyl-CoA desaturase (delta-9 desaturase)